MSLRRSLDAQMEAWRDQLFRLVFAHAPIGIGVVSQEAWLQVNRELCSILGCDEGELLGQALEPWVLPEDRQRLFALMYRELGAAAEQEAEIRFLRSSAGCVTVCVRSSAFDPPEGERCFVLQLEDLSERKRAERQLRESEARFRLLAENMSDMVGIHALDGAPIYVSPSAERLLGYAPQDLLGNPSYLLTHPDDRARVREAHEALLAAKAPIVVACRIRRADGSYLWCEMTAMPILDERGEVKHIQTATRDISRRMATEEALRESERKFRAIFEAQPGAILYADAAGRIREVNPAAEKLFGYRARELLGRDLRLLLPPDADYAELEGSILAQPGRVLWSYELECQRQDGSRFPAELTATALGEGPAVQGYLWMLRDISAKKRAQQDLADAREQLTRSREDERLHIARELHDGSVQDLISISYQLASLLRGCQGREVVASELQSALQTLRQDVVGVIKELRGTISELRPADFDEFGFEGSLEGYVAKLARQRGAAMPQVELEVAGDFDALSAPVKICLFRAVQEALSNAVKHAGAEQVTVRLKRLPREVVLVVADDGRGFEAPEEFGDLVKADHFGLAGINERVTLMGGALSVCSQPGQGSELSVTLPLQEEDSLDG